MCNTKRLRKCSFTTSLTHSLLNPTTHSYTLSQLSLSDAIIAGTQIQESLILPSFRNPGSLSIPHYSSFSNNPRNKKKLHLRRKGSNKTQRNNGVHVCASHIIISSAHTVVVKYSYEHNTMLYAWWSEYETCLEGKALPVGSYTIARTKTYFLSKTGRKLTLTLSTCFFLVFLVCSLLLLMFQLASWQY